MKWRKSLRRMTPFISCEKMRVSTSPSSSPSIRIPRSRVKKKLSSFKQSHDKKECELVIRRVAHEDHVAVLTYRWGRRSARTRDKTERSLPHKGLAGVVEKGQENTWVKSGAERSKRESEIMVTASELLGDETLDEETRKLLQKGLRHLRRIRDAPSLSIPIQRLFSRDNRIQQCFVDH